VAGILSPNVLIVIVIWQTLANSATLISCCSQRAEMNEAIIIRRWSDFPREIVVDHDDAPHPFSGNKRHITRC
jgi:hypothetical protein